MGKAENLYRALEWEHCKRYNLQIIDPPQSSVIVLRRSVRG